MGFAIAPPILRLGYCDAVPFNDYGEAGRP